MVIFGGCRTYIAKILYQELSLLNMLTVVASATLSFRSLRLPVGRQV